MTPIVLNNWCATFSRKGLGIPCIIYFCFLDFKFICKTKYVEQSSLGKDNKQACEWDDHTIMPWDYENANVIYFSGEKEGNYDVDISQ
jgi:hypothetical protein